MSRLHVTAIAIRGNSTFATSQNAAPATTSRKATSQSAAPATKKRHACIDTLPKYCACHAKHENDLTFCDLGTPKRAFRARLPPLFTPLKVRIVSQCECTAQWQRINELATTTRRRHDDEATTTRRRGDDDTTTTRGKQREHRSNPRPPTTKREPFATHSGKTTEGEKAKMKCVYEVDVFPNMFFLNDHLIYIKNDSF